LHFKAYNLIFKSSIDLSDYGFIKVEEKNHDIEIILKQENCVLPKSQYCIHSLKSHYYVKDKVFFQVKNGNLIEIYPLIKDVDQIKQFIVNFPIALCLSQRSKFVMHASAVSKNGTMLIFCGKSHAGKSTLAYKFKQKSWDIVSEDIFVLDLKSGEILTSPPIIKLSKESCKQFNIDFEKGISNNTGDRKFFLRDRNLNTQCKTKYCYFLNWGDSNKIRQISHQMAIKELYKYSFISSDKPSAQKVLLALKYFSFGKLIIKKNMLELDDVYKEVVKKLV
tara:strand:+ start:22825 stop:23661 length:837 start_codon:yes stop_codon:yes gene_type:complete